MKQTIEVEVLEDYELSSTINNITFDGKKTTMIFWEKKQKKDFDWYIDQYLTESLTTVDNIAGWINDRDLEVAKNRLKTKQFNLVPWEIKIGLFRFICENLELNTINCLSYCFEYTIHSNVSKIISQEFIDSLKQNKN